MTTCVSELVYGGARTVDEEAAAAPRMFHFQAWGGISDYENRHVEINNTAWFLAQEVQVSSQTMHGCSYQNVNV
jgi:hypothetical protein